MRLVDVEPVIQFIEDGLNNPDKKKAFGYDAIEILSEIEYAPTVEPAVATIPVGADFGWVLVFAMRHIAWGRKNERDLVMQFITPLIPYLGDSTLAVLDRDMSDDYAQWGYGDPVVYEPPWRELHALVKQERRRRVGISD